MRERDEAEFVEFAQVALRRLRLTAYLMCGDWHRAEDAAQDALVRVYQRWSRLEHHGGLHSYAHKAVVSVVLDQSRKPWRRERVSADNGEWVEWGEARSTGDAAAGVDDRLLAIEALAQLPPRQRACVVLRHYLDLSVADTADALGISNGAVKAHTSRGLVQLRTAFDQSRPGHQPQAAGPARTTKERTSR